MPTNKSQVDETALVQIETVKGTKFTQGKLRVDAGTVGVVTLDGAWRETLQPGGYWYARYPFFTQCKIYRVDMKDRQMTVETKSELIIQKPAPLPVDMTAVLSYRVVDPKIVALDIATPLGNLFDFTIEAMRDATNQLHHDDFMKGGGAPTIILKHLQSRGLDQYLGIQVLNIQISNIKADERARQLQVEQTLGLQEMELQGKRQHLQNQFDMDIQHQQDQYQMELQHAQALSQQKIAQITDLTPEWVMLNKPEMYPVIFGNAEATQEQWFNFLIEAAKVGAISSDQLNQLAPGVADALGTAPGIPASQQQAGGGNLPAPQQGQPTVSATERINDECSAMLNAGYNVILKEEDGGYYFITIQTKNSVDQSLAVYIVCGQNYPTRPPQQVMVELEGQEVNFNSQTVQYWSYDKTLLDIINEIVGFYG